MIAWTRIHAFVAILITSDVRWAATRPAQVRNVWDIVPHGENIGTRRAYKGGRFNANALPPLISNKGPTIPVGPPPANPTCHGAPLTGVRVGPSAWPPATRQRHLRLAWATRALPRGLSAVSHLEVVPRAMSAPAAPGHHVSTCR